MNGRLPHSLAEVFAVAVRWHLRRQRGEIDSIDARELREWREFSSAVFSVLSESMALTMRPHKASVDRSMPGYIVLPVGDDEDLKAYVPYYLAELIPLGSLLASLVRLSQHIRLNPGSIICLSGSTCQMSLGLQVADLDFCEYLPSFDEQVWSRLRNWTSSTVSEGPLLYRVSLGPGQSWGIPWADSFQTSSESTRASAQSDFDRAMRRQCVFAGAVEELGVLEVTNLVLKLDFGAPEAAAEAAKSFAAQEVPLSDVGWTPRDLCEPLHFGRYVCWLLDSAEEHFKKSRTNPRDGVKAARRLISATRLLAMSDDVDALVDLLREDGARLAALKDRCELHASLTKSGGKRGKSFLPTLRTTIDALRGSITTPKSAYGLLTASEQAKFEAFALRARPQLESALRKVRRTVSLA